MPVGGVRTFILSGPPLHVASRQPGFVEFWTEEGQAETVREYHLKAVGTGDLVDDTWRHVGTAMDVYGLVWHLYELP